MVQPALAAARSSLSGRPSPAGFSPQKRSELGLLSNRLAERWTARTRFPKNRDGHHSSTVAAEDRDDAPLTSGVRGTIGMDFWLNITPDIPIIQTIRFPVGEERVQRGLQAALLRARKERRLLVVRPAYAVITASHPRSFDDLGPLRQGYNRFSWWAPSPISAIAVMKRQVVGGARPGPHHVAVADMGRVDSVGSPARHPVQCVGLGGGVS